MKLLILLPCLFFSLISAGPIGNLADRYELSQTRNTVGESNYTMSCYDDEATAYCADPRFGYRCDSDGTVERIGPFINAGCSMYCACRNLGEGVDTCPSGWTWCSSANTTADTGSPKREVRSISKTSQSFHVHILEEKAADNQYAIICGDDKDVTDFCTSMPFNYFCSIEGKLKQSKKSPQFFVCRDNCRCVNLLPLVCPAVVIGCKRWPLAPGLPELAASAHGAKSTEASDIIVREVVSTEASGVEVEISKSHSYALVCKVKGTTEWCSSSRGYHCDSAGNILYSTYWGACSQTCTCMNTGPEMPFCTASLHPDCYEPGSSMFLDNSTDILTNGTLTTAAGFGILSANSSQQALDTQNPNMTSSDLAIFSAQPLHELARRSNFALVCKNKIISGSCQSLGYYCSVSGHIVKPKDPKKISKGCNKICKCKNVGILPPTICVVEPVLAQCFSAEDAHEAVTINGTDSGSDIGDTDLVTTESSPSTDSPLLVRSDTEPNSLDKRHNWALVCRDSGLTKTCTQSGYRCDGLGFGFINPGGKKTPSCNAWCQCINIGTLPSNICITDKAVQPLCFAGHSSRPVVSFDGKATSGPVNGTSPSVDGRAPDEPTSNNGTTTTTSDFALTAGSEPSSLQKRHNWALVCLDSELTKSCASVGYLCNDGGKVQLQPWGKLYSGCSAHCGCTNIGSLNPGVCILDLKSTICYSKAEASTSNKTLFAISGTDATLNDVESGAKENDTRYERS